MTSAPVNPYPLLWREVEAAGEYPQRATGTIRMPFDSFRAKVLSFDVEFADYLVRSLYAGKCWVLRGAFDPGWMREVKRRAFAWMHASPSSFHQMREGTPDFHRIIDLEIGKRYAFRSCYHKAAFYRWNGDPLGIWPEVSARWRLAKILSGYAEDEYVANTPRDGVIDRLQVARYPPSIGYLEPHQDAHQHYRVNISGYMSRRGVDYRGGGLYLVDPRDEALEIENEIEVGDATLACPTVAHGVAPCDRGVEPDWNADDGRWALLMYSADSDERETRYTGRPLGIDLPGVLP